MTSALLPRIGLDVPSIRFLLQYAQDRLKLRYRRTYLGFVWNLLDPALYLVVLSVVFSVVNRMEIGDYAVFLIGALVPWRYFEGSVQFVMVSVEGGEWLIKKMPSSPLVLPLSNWLVSTFEFAFSLIVMLLIFAVIKPAWTVHVWILPLAIVPWLLLSLGCGLWCAVVYTFFRDVGSIVRMGLMFTFFTSPILFKLDLFAGHSLQAALLKWHPITYYAALMQKPLYFGAWPSAVDWAVTVGLGLALLLSGWLAVLHFGRRFFYSL